MLRAFLPQLLNDNFWTPGQVKWFDDEREKNKLELYHLTVNLAHNLY